MTLSKFDVDYVEIQTGALSTSTVTAVSVEDALRHERLFFGEPFFRVLRGRPHVEKLQAAPAKAEAGE